jgi:carbonyl reductase 1
LVKPLGTLARDRWFDDFSQAKTPEQAVLPILDLVLAEQFDPAAYGELVRFGQVLPWHGGKPLPQQDQLLAK